MRVGSVLFLAALPGALAAQQNIQGRVVDAASGAPLEYVSIGALPCCGFTLSHADGSFTLEPADSVRTDSILFSLLGYERTALARAGWPSAEVEVRMRARTQELPTAEVTAVRLEERKLGIRSHHPFFTYLFEEKDMDEIVEMAQVVDLGPTPVRIRAVNLYVASTPMDSATFRIGFRGFDGERPTGPLVERSLVRRVPLSEGWQRLDLEGEQLALSGKLAITLELLPDPAGRPRNMSVGIRLGGGEPGFDRRTTFDAWNQPPHRYSINVSALVGKDHPAEEPEDPEPYLRSVDVRLWSPAVQDTFSIAFGLPEDFAPTHPGGYPTVYLLDANLYFDDVLRALRKEARRGSLPPVILVGVGYRDFMAMDSLRQRDYLVPASDSVPHSGGGEHFLGFLRDTLEPYVERRFPTDTTRCAIAGHSFGGYFALYALQSTMLHGRTPFTAFIAGSPPLDYAGGILLDAMKEAATDGARHILRVFIGHGSEDQGSYLTDYLAEVRKCIGRFAIERRYPGADHMATALPSFTDGVRALWGGERK